MRRTTILQVLFAVGCASIGCSLVNSFDEVVPLSDPDASYLPFNPPPEPEKDAQTNDVAQDASVHTNVIVVAGDEVSADAGAVAARRHVLAVLDSSTGRELGVREAMTVAGIVHDDARDLWYIFESSGDFIPGRTDIATLHVRSLDGQGVWTEITKSVVPTPQNYQLYAATTQRLSYVAYSQSDAAGPLELVTLDTSVGASVLASQPLAVAPVGIVGHRSTTGPGGRLTLTNINRAGCVFGGPPGTITFCPVVLDGYLVPNSGAPALIAQGKPLENISPFGLPAWGAIECSSPADLFVLPKSGSPTVFEIAQTSPDLSADPTPPDPVEARATVLPALKGGFLRRAAVDDKDRVVFVVETNADLALHAVALGTGGQHVSVPLGHSGQSVYFDPGSSTVFAPFNQGSGFSFSPHHVAIKVQPNGDRLPELTARVDDWNPPNDLRPTLLGIKKPATLVCP